jgi:hypothetical protein
MRKHYNNLIKIQTQYSKLYSFFKIISKYNLDTSLGEILNYCAKKLINFLFRYLTLR